ncbi:MAG: 3-oxoacyl-ACP reductase [Chloroflexi bacterium RBG_16_68_14]|nr:MAG: 3-oxoacyl-ACP reductase [Chloroflexi bacterium RBG_16_68_14]
MASVSPWALILGASSGFGEATSLELARTGYHIFGVHLDLRATLPNAQRIQEEIRSLGREALFFNVNAADAEKRASVIEAIEERLRQDGDEAFVRVFLHSLAFGTLLPYIAARPAGKADSPKNAISQKQMEMTVDVMGHSLVYWVQGLVARNLMRRGSRIFAMTSSGSTRVIRSYGAISAAKAALESHIRQLAFELAPLGITANAIRAGVTDTPALRRIPEGPELLARLRERHPAGRTTTPQDVARAIAALADERLEWMTGNVIGVDGGEDLTA